MPNRDGQTTGTGWVTTPARATPATVKRELNVPLLTDVAIIWLCARPCVSTPHTGRRPARHRRRGLCTTAVKELATQAAAWALPRGVAPPLAYNGGCMQGARRPARSPSPASGHTP